MDENDDALLDAVRQRGGEASLDELMALAGNVSRRTLQRRVRELVLTYRLRAVGHARARRYRLPTPPDRGYDEVREEVETTAVVFAPDSREVMDELARLGRERRMPIGYQRDFVDAYEPNRTFYLAGSLRHELRRIGWTGDETRPAGTHARAILARLLIDLSWASSRLEGNTYSRPDTRELIEHGHIATGRDFLETQMILNHKAAIEFLVGNVEDIELDPRTIRNLHGLLSENLVGDIGDEGNLRKAPVYIGGSVYRPLAIPQLLEELFERVLSKARLIEDAFEQSFFLMVHLPYLQPFIDVNKRVSRLAANLPLLRANLAPLTFVGVLETDYARAHIAVYELNRIEPLRDLYLAAYRASVNAYARVRLDVPAPDPVRLQWRDVVREVLRTVVLTVERESASLVRELLSESVDDASRPVVEALVNQELARLNEGVLARYRLTPDEFERWRTRHRA